MKLRWPLGLYRVAGESMMPTYRPGDLLLGVRYWRRLAPGVCVAARVRGRPVIKRVSRLEGDKLWLVGDHSSASTDSRNYGAVPTSAVEAVMIARYRRRKT